MRQVDFDDREAFINKILKEGGYEPTVEPESAPPVEVAEVALPQEKTEAQPQRYDNLFDWMESLVVAVVLTVFIFCFLGRVATVSGVSMLPTLNDKDMVLVSDLFYTPSNGDVVIVTRAESPDEPLVKRVIAIAGQEIDIDFDAGVVYVDNVALDENYVNTDTNRSFDMEFPQTVPEGCVFLMGDNRNHSLDSRDSTIGMVDSRYIMGKVRMRLLPVGNFGSID